ncbi:MAG: 2-isopropylmalate synthase [Clostridia bacterium]|nr:2-isopropylmalate synthase [Clostridia bacterium]
MDNKIYIFDTTLRDGEQTPGVSLNIKEKIIIAKQLDKLGVDCIEAGFPIASIGDFEAVKAVAEVVQNAEVAGLSRANFADIDRCWEAIKNAKRPRIHTFIATSPIHMKYKLKMEPQAVIEAAVKAVKHAKNYVENVEFSAEDAFRSEVPFLCELFEQVIDAGATTINIPDTVGYATPKEYGAFIKSIKEGTPNINKARISVHCHNDLGLAVANSLAAIQNGATQVETTVNGLGERAGNASMEELVMALFTRGDYYNKETNIIKEEIYRSSNLVSRLTGVAISPNKAIVGKNAFAHESGIHQDGMLKNRETYEIMNPEMIGVPVDTLVLGKHSGRNGFKAKLMELGYEIEGDRLNDLFARFKDLCDKKKEIRDEDLIALVDEEILKEDEIYEFKYLHVSSGTNISATATVGLKLNYELIEKAEPGKGPIEAIYKAINSIVNGEFVLEDYKINSITSGKDAQGEVLTKVRYKGRVFIGKGVSVDIIEASARSYVNGINKALNYEKKYS